MTIKQKQIDFESQFSITIVTDGKGTHYSCVMTEDGEMVFEQSENSYEREDALAAAEHWIYMAYQSFLDEQPDDDQPSLTSDQEARELGVRFDRT